MLDPFTLHQGGDVFWEVTVLLFSKINDQSSKTNCRFIFFFYFMSLYTQVRVDVFHTYSIYFI